MVGEYFDTGNDPRIVFSINILDNTLRMLKSKRIGEFKNYNFETKYKRC